MAFPRLVANDSIVGIDIGSRMIKIMHAEIDKQGVRVTHVAMCPTPPNSVKESVVVDTDAVAGAIKFALRSQGIKTTAAVAAIVGPGVSVRQVQLPRMSEAALRKSIRFEAGRFISTSIEDSIVEFDILDDPAEEGQMNIVLAAAPRVMIDSRVAVLEQAGLEPIAIDLEVFAALRSLVEYSTDPAVCTGTIAMLDMGSSHTEINLISNGRLALNRTIPIAGDGISSVIKNTEGCTDEEAEQKKYSLDLSELIDLRPGATEDPTLRAVQSLIDELLREIRRSINYYQSQLGESSTDNSITTLFLCGGTARLKGLAAYTKSRLNLEITSSNPMLSKLLQQAELSGTSEEDLPLLGVAFGLAVRELPNHDKIVLTAA